MLYPKVLERIIRDKQIKERGGHLGIPYPFARLNEYLPVIEKGHSIGVLAGTGVGKSKFGRYVFIYHTYKFCKETGYKAHVIYFPLEDNKEKVYNSMICYFLAEEHNINISVQELTSRKRTLPDFVVEKLTEAYAYFEEFEQFVEFIDDRTTPKEIYSYCREHAIKTGKYNKEDNSFHSDIHTIVIVDNMSNLDTDDECPTEREAMIKLARDYGRKKMCNLFRFTFVQLMQLSFDKERQQYTHSGLSIISKLEPSLDGIGEAKVISRFMHLVLGIFNPSRYELMQYPIPSKHDPENCYRIDIMGNRFRSIKIIKSNDSDMGMRIGLKFNPFSEVFEELPLPKTEEIKSYYATLTKDRVNNFVKSDNNLKFAEDYSNDDDKPF